MIGSLFNDLQPNKRDEPEDSELTGDLSYDAADGDDSLLASIGVALKIVRRKGVSSRQNDSADIVQSIALRLIGWRDKYREKSAEMSPDDWQSFAARVAYNEVNRHFSGEASSKDLPIDAAAEVSAPETLEGESLAEVFSLVRRFWQEFCNLSVRQRRALLLHSQELVLYFLEIEITDEELAAVLEMSVSDWIESSEKIPLTDAEIAELVLETGSGKNKSLDAQAKSIKKARHEARVKLKKITRR